MPLATTKLIMLNDFIVRYYNLLNLMLQTWVATKFVQLLSKKIASITFLKRIAFLEMDYLEVLRHVVTEWWLFLPAVEDTLQCWLALCSYSAYSPEDAKLLPLCWYDEFCVVAQQEEKKALVHGTALNPRTVKAKLNSISKPQDAFISHYKYITPKISPSSLTI